MEMIIGIGLVLVLIFIVGGMSNNDRSTNGLMISWRECMANFLILQDYKQIPQKVQNYIAKQKR